MSDTGDHAHDDEVLPDAHPIILVRGQQVMLASSVELAFRVETREVNQTRRRHETKFTTAHAFELTAAEVDGLRSQAVISNAGRGGSRALPWVFTHKGAVRLATLMNAPAALEATDAVWPTKRLPPQPACVSRGKRQNGRS